MNSTNLSVESQLIADVRLLIEATRSQVSRAANSSLTLLYWQVGKRINDEILLDQRAEYGKQIGATLSHQLKQEYGRNFEEKTCAG